MSLLSSTAVSAIAVFAASSAVFCQGEKRIALNNPYSPSPAYRLVDGPESDKPVVTNVPVLPAESVTRRPLTEIYKVGVGDILHVNFKNSDNGSGYYTVFEDGSIDYPLAGDNVVVTDKTPDQIARDLTAAVTLYPDPKFSVTVRQYSSHRFMVKGLVMNGGEETIGFSLLLS